MTESGWKKKLNRDCKTLGTYKEEFDTVINTLSKILAQRDSTYDQFVAEGSHTVIIKISDRGAENRAKNPLLAIWKELNDQAIVYLRELGLSPKGYKAITDDDMKNQHTDALAQALKELS